MWLWFCLVCAMRLVWVLPSRITGLRCCRRRRTGNVKAMVVLGSGGHTGEMLRLLPTMTDTGSQLQYTPIVFVTAATDSISAQRAAFFFASAPHVEPVFEAVPRSREVGQSWVSTVWTTLVSCIAALGVVGRHRPQLLLVNGPGTCVPLCLAAVLLKVLGVCGTRIVFVESVCRVDGLSLTGKILFPIADRVVVQWRQLHRPPLTDYVGVLF